MPFPRRSTDDEADITLEWVQLGALIIPEYQRAEDVARTDAMAADWQPLRCGALTVVPSTLRPGKFDVLDGQQRASAARKAGVAVLPCVVGRPMLQTLGAGEFVAINRDRKAVTAMDRHRASVMAQDPKALAVERAVTHVGMRIGGRNAGRGFGTTGRTSLIAAVKGCYDLLDRGDEEHLVEVLTVIIETWQREGSSFTRAMLLGVGRFLQTYPELPRSEITARWATVNPVRAQQDAAAASKGDRQGKVGTALSYLLAEAYNRGRRNRIDPNLVFTRRTMPGQ